MRHIFGLVLLAIAPVCSAAQTWDFEYQYVSVMDANARDHVVSESGINYVNETSTISFAYPVTSGVAAQQRMHFVFPAATTRLYMRSILTTWNNGAGVGFGTLWGSKDGVNWTLLLDAPTPTFAQAYVHDGDLPVELLGASELWLEVRLMRTSGYYWGGGAQFSRNDTSGAANPAFVLKADYFEDCNGNGISDSEDLSSGTSTDCDANNIPDECDIAANPALDSNSNGILDACECMAVNYCQASINSAGTSASIGWQGEFSLSANNFSLGVLGAPPLKFGIFFYGANQTQMPLGEGLLCVAFDVQRIQPLVITDQQGTALMPIDLTSAVFSSGPFAVTPFSTWNFQFWYRDPAGGPAGFNFSDGLEVTFCP